jgi:hypothetical protein
MFVPPAKGSSQEGGPDRSTLFPERWTRVKFVGGGTRTVKDDWIGEGADSDLGADWTGETWFHFEAADRTVGKTHPIFSLGLLPPRETQARPSGRGDSSALLFINDGEIMRIAGLKGDRWQPKPVGWQQLRAGRLASIVQEWEWEHSFVLPTPPKGQFLDMPYRIVFAISPDGSVLPVQQCLRHKFELCHEIGPLAWSKDHTVFGGVRASQFTRLGKILTEIQRINRDTPRGGAVKLPKSARACCVPEGREGNLGSPSRSSSARAGTRAAGGSRPRKLRNAPLVLL